MTESLRLLLPDRSLEVCIFGTQGPLVLFCHGFPGVFKNEDLAEALAGSGFTVWLLKYRGVNGSSGEFNFMKALSDVRETVLWAENLGYRQIGLFGYSAGAYYGVNVASSVGTVKALCLLSPVSNLPRAARASFENIVELMLTAQDIIRMESFHDVVASFAEIWHEYNVLTAIPKLAGTPLLIIDGDDPKRGDVQQSQLLFDAAQDPKELRLLSGAGHYFDDQLSRQELRGWIIAFFRQHLARSDRFCRQDKLLYAYYPDASKVPEDHRSTVGRWLDQVADHVWNKDPRYWQENPALFEKDMSIALVLSIAAGAPVGFLVYRTIRIPEGALVYIEGINFLLDYQGRGLFSKLCLPLLASEVAHLEGQKLYLCARTRHPAVITIMEKICLDLAPSSKASQLLISNGKRFSEFLFPDLRLEIPSMILRDTYTEFSYRAEPALEGVKWRNRQQIEELGEKDAYFVVGETDFSRIHSYVNSPSRFFSRSASLIQRPPSSSIAINPAADT